MTTDLQQRLEQALAYQQSNQVDAAMAAFKQILTEYPHQPDALHGLGLIFAQQREYQQALHYLKEAVKAAPNIAPFHNNLANAYKAVGKADEAIRHYREALRLKNPYPEVYNNLGALLYTLGKYQEAAEHLQKSIRMDPLAVDTHYNLANCYIHLERYLDAATHYEEVLKLRSDHLGAMHNLGITYCLLKRFDSAKPLLEEVIAREPNNIDALFHLGIINSALANPLAAQKYYLAVLVLDPNHAASHHNLATVYLHTHQLDKALAHYKRAYALEPQNKTAQHLIAALSGQTLAEGAPHEYTQALFDQYAYTYDRHVKEQLHYKVPYFLRSLIAPFISNEVLDTAADLGCGTGMCAPLFADVVNKIIGVDLSSNMIEIARQQGGYFKLYVQDILSFLARYNQEFDLAIAADVFVYFGSLDDVWAATFRALKPEGLFCFSIEELPADPATLDLEYQVNPTGRYAHRLSYILALAQRHQFTVLAQEAQTIRIQDDEPVHGHLFVLRKKSLAEETS